MKTIKQKKRAAKKARKALITRLEFREILYHVINAGLSGLLVLLGAYTTGNLHEVSFFVASVTALIVFVTKMKDYWTGEEGQYSSKVLNFVSA